MILWIDSLAKVEYQFWGLSMANSQSSTKIICIEDEMEMIELIKLILIRRGYTFFGAGSGEQGLSLIRDTKPDLVLLDLMMPGGIDGWGVYQQMKADPDLQDIPVIIITAKAQNIDKILGLHIAKVNDYITKPFSPGELLQSIEAVLGSPEALRPNHS
jgi:DNA-binding response OmpR family regulator